MRKHRTVLLIAVSGVLVASSLAAAAQRPRSITIAASPTAIVYGGRVTLAGSISPAEANERIQVEARACGQNSFTRLSDTRTTAAGTWTVAAAPLLNTAYQARARGVSSQQVAVQVRPRMALAKVRAHRFRVTVSAAQSFAGKRATFQRFSRALGRWVRVRGVTLTSVQMGTPTVVTRATFRSGIRSGRRVRAVLAQSQVGACYLGGISNAIRS
jgi:hypothetical protein